MPPAGRPGNERSALDLGWLSSTPPPGAGGPSPELRAIVGRIQRGGMMLGVLLAGIVLRLVVEPAIRPIRGRLA